MKTVRLHLGTFDYQVYVVVGRDRARIMQFVRTKLDDPSIPATSTDDKRGCFFIRDGRVPVIWLPRVPRTAREHATLAHESLHVTAAVMRWAGIPFTEDTEEVYTHTMSAIITGTLEKLRA